MFEVPSRPFREAHADLFQVMPEYEKEFRAKVGLLNHLGRTAQAGIHVVNGRILFVSAWFEASPGVIEGMIYPSIHIHDHKKIFFREVRWWLRYLKSEYRRVQCWGEDTELSKRWLKALGFELEGKLQDFCANGDAMLVWRLL